MKVLSLAKESTIRNSAASCNGQCVFKSPVDGPRPMFEDANWDYYGWVISIISADLNAEDVILFYPNRGHAENFIREIMIAAQVVRQARQTVIVFPKHLEEEVNRCVMNINRLGLG